MNALSHTMSWFKHKPVQNFNISRQQLVRALHTTFFVMKTEHGQIYNDKSIDSIIDPIGKDMQST
jgi:hypothetical protein